MSTKHMLLNRNKGFNNFIKINGRDVAVHTVIVKGINAIIYIDIIKLILNI